MKYEHNSYSQQAEVFAQKPQETSMVKSRRNSAQCSGPPPIGCSRDSGYHTESSTNASTFQGAHHACKTLPSIPARDPYDFSDLHRQHGGSPPVPTNRAPLLGTTASSRDTIQMRPCPSTQFLRDSRFNEEDVSAGTPEMWGKSLARSKPSPPTSSSTSAVPVPCDRPPPLNTTNTHILQERVDPSKQERSTKSRSQHQQLFSLSRCPLPLLAHRHLSSFAPAIRMLASRATRIRLCQPALRKEE